MATFLDVDPATLHVPPSRLTGVDLFKLARQIARYGQSTAGLPPWVHRDANGRLKIMNGVTRATRVAQLLPETLIRVEVTAEEPSADFSNLPTIGDTLS